MKIHEVENMSADELKTGQAEIVKALDGNAELAARYVQARLDAKIRDEKLAEQAKTLEALQVGIDLATQAANAAKEETAKAKGIGDTLGRELDTVVGDARTSAQQCAALMAEQVEEHNKQLDSLRSEHSVIDTAARASQQIGDKMIADLTQRCDRLKVQAETYDAAITTIHKAAADAIASRELARADQGE